MMQKYPTIGMICLAFFLLVACESAGAPVDPKSPPNILLVVADDLNVALGCYGDAKALTPNLDRLAKRGVRFDRAHVQFPLCGPSRVSFLTGRRPEATGVYILNTPAHVALPEAVQLPQFFKQNGYHTVGVGKIAHSPKTNDPDAWHEYEDGKSKDDQENAAIELRYGGGDGRPRGHRLDGDGSLTRDGSNAAAIRKLIADRPADAPPFFYALGFQKPHLPWTAPKRFFEMHDATQFDISDEKLKDIPNIALQTELSGFGQPENTPEAIRSYYACVSFIDHELGLILDELDRQHLTNNTVVVFFSDHGFHLGDHDGLWAKQSAFGQSTRVPLIIAGPGVPAGIEINSPVELIDVFPTLADLAGFDAPKPLDGRSLLSLFDAPEPNDRVAYSLVYHYDVAANRDVAGRTVISDRWRYTEWDDGRDGQEFYWHATDPNEHRNRYADASIVYHRTEALNWLQPLPRPKPGPANRPRALLPPGVKKK